MKKRQRMWRCAATITLSAMMLTLILTLNTRADEITIQDSAQNLNIINYDWSRMYTWIAPVAEANDKETFSLNVSAKYLSAEAYKTIVLDANTNNAKWTCDNNNVFLIRLGKRCVVYSTEEGTAIISCKAENDNFDTEITFTQHQHVADEYSWGISKDATCEKEGEAVQYCNICHKIIDTGVLPALGHDYSDEQIIQAATPIIDGKLGKICSRCGNTEITGTYSCIDDVASEAANRGNYGRLYIPDVGIDVALFMCSMWEGQYVIDNWDSAAYMYDFNRPLIGDHNYQGFSGVGNCYPGMQMYIVTPNGIQTYTCTEAGSGVNVDYTILTDSGTDLLNGGGGIVLYTCQPGSDGTYIYYAIFY